MSDMDNVTLKNQHATVVISPKLGGSVMSYECFLGDNMRPVFAALTDNEGLANNCFPLVPYSNRIRDGKFAWQGKQVSLPLNHLPEKHSLHGHGWQAEWELVSQSDHQIVIEYEHLADDWPFQYKAQQIFSLDNGCLNIELVLTNLSGKEMPAGLGLHPFFTRTQESHLQCSVGQMWAVDDECMPTELTAAPKEMLNPTGLRVNDSCLDNAFTDFSSEAVVYWPEWQAKATMTASKDCRFVVIYSPKHENFFCVEPVTHCTDAVNMSQQGVENTGARALKPSEQMRVSMSIKPEVST